MARMIPPYFAEQTASPGEREIFIRLRDDPLTHDWTILHSLDIVHHREQISGEIDFVLIIPEKGVLCVEVKACRSLSRSNGLWFYGTQPHGDARGPFKQASSAMHSLRKVLIDKHPELRGLLFWSAVIFPYLRFTNTSPEWHQWQVIDSSGFTRSLSQSLLAVMNNAKTFFQSHPRTAHLYQGHEPSPTSLQTDQIIASLRSHFEFFESPQSRRNRLECDLKRYTIEQSVALDAMATNPRVIFAGPAGTGKTILAIESVRQSVASGRRVLFLCFNRSLSQHLIEQVQDLGTQVKCATIHSYMLQLVNISADLNNPTFWKESLPNAAIEHLLDQSEVAFDEIVIDEAQDILRDNYLDVLDLSVIGGLAAGRWRFFGDFEKQAIYDAADVSLDSFIKNRVPNVPVFRLRINCRNTPRIVEHVHLLSGLTPKYSRTLRPDDQREPEIHYYQDDITQKNLLISIMERLYSEGFAGRDIVILSPISGKNSLAYKIHQHPWKERLTPFRVRDQPGGYIQHTSIAAFKGMESAVVIVTDIETILGLHASSLLYIAVTRALQHLILLMHTSTKKEIQQVLSLQ
ncbi:NERD domain-containing protein [Herpetosiphon giganteus]|uniref:NERD domain-containing protein n=1 Tax=Herpetosiphon giganteus TaxID=2029754 RepID=UPI00195629AF|nr:NERD domain-containing protein [Herpetosiphon giganteus]MBM7841617.1 DNA polymerase III delta prime subunit [Herpetosiphon giganteus]